MLLRLVSYWPHLTLWPATARRRCLSEPVRRDAKWLGVSQCGPADGSSSSGWAIEGTPSLLRALPRATAAPKTNTSSMFDVDSLL